jgi:hypothetical protein
METWQVFELPAKFSGMLGRNLPVLTVQEYGSFSPMGTLPEGTTFLRQNIKKVML